MCGKLWEESTRGEDGDRVGRRRHTSHACEDLSGYTSAISTVLGKYAATTGNYECDAFVDRDADLVGDCLDGDDNNPRVGINEGS